MYRWIQKTWNEQPLLLILCLAILFRFIAVIFGKGWGMIDDHFLVVESAQSWVDGFDVTYWMPWSPENSGPTGHLLLYPGFHFILFSVLEWMHITDPEVKMFIDRFLHAAFSLLTIIYGYRIAGKLGSRESARLTGLLLAVLWFMPWLSVRNLVEVVCIPFLMMGFWQIIKTDSLNNRFGRFLIAGILFGLAVDIRIQTFLFPLGIGLVLLFQWRWRELLGMALGTLLPMLLILGTIDLFLWGYPFAEIIGYIKVNITERGQYISLPWYNYFLVILGFLIPPISFFLFFGYLRTWKRALIIFVPVLIFLLFHSWFPNKQERFILPIIPFIVVLGVVGWHSFLERSGFWKNHRKLLKGCWIFFWIINFILLPVITTNYSKRARVETMVYLSRYPDLHQLLVADDDDRPILFPRFYLGQWPHIWASMKDGETAAEFIQRAALAPPGQQPEFILFTGPKNIQERVIDARNHFPWIVYETTIEPGFIDWLVHWLNPINKNNRVYIYRNTARIPNKIGSEQ